MFGYVIINKPELKIKDFDIYRGFYCGLCQSLKKEFNNLARFSLNYDMTFLAILLSGLYEPDTECIEQRCIVHPMHKQQRYDNVYLRYAADMTIVLTYLKCEDNWQDDHSHTARLYQTTLKHSFQRIKERYPQKLQRIQDALDEIARCEAARLHDLDRLSALSGSFMAEILCFKEDEWSDTLRKMGDYLGRFIYLLDAYDDLEEDKKQGRFNPLIEEEANEHFDDRIHSILELMIASSCEAFEILPILKYEDILRNVLYSGVWAKYEAARKKRTGEEDGRSV